MNQGRESAIYYFERKGPENTDRTLDISLAACDQRGIKRIIVASSSGETALSGTERTFENKYKSGFIPLNIVADTLRMFSQGMKVCVEAAVMAAEHGFVKPEEDVVVPEKREVFHG